ncbi:MAG: molybdate ABC transporter permease subunit [Gammaproteobacteria bacterium]|nr:molybdate ABC transporter permease subunit [Gammaproteobacteria bacterium]MYD79033.1 molybdate ABC transporter permease subunit [Gammaproteobacteria bacterium]
MLSPVWLTVQLASITTVLLLVIGTPVAWWIARSRSRFKPIVEAITALPLVLPPTVLGFYLLYAFNPNAPLGSFFVWITGETLVFSFQGLVAASLIYSLPFMVQPLRVAFEDIDSNLLDATRVLGANSWTRFFLVVVPISYRGFITAAVLTFAHTVGEFGVVLMIGGSIPGETKVLSIAIYEMVVETISNSEAHQLSLGLLVFSFLVLVGVYTLNRKDPLRVS